jgi:hypothetical protein
MDAHDRAAGGWIPCDAAAINPVRKMLVKPVDPTFQHKNRAEVLIDGPEIVIRPVAIRQS